MKKLVSIFFMVGLISISGLYAQKQGQKQRMQEVNAKTKAELNLSESQSKEWDKIQIDYVNELKVLRANESISKEDKKGRTQALRKEKEVKIKSLLSEEQMERLIEIRKELREQNKANYQKQKNVNKSTEKGSPIMKMKENLNLSEEQLEKWDKIVAENRLKMQEINKDESLSEEVKREKMKVKRGEIQTEIMAILTSEQQAIYTREVDEIQKRRKEQQKQSKGQLN